MENAKTQVAEMIMEGLMIGLADRYGKDYPELKDLFDRYRRLQRELDETMNEIEALFEKIEKEAK